MTNQSIDYARARAKANEWTVAKILKHLASIPEFDFKFWEHCRTIQDELVPALLKAMQEQVSIARLNASLLLLRLGQPDGTDGIIACLRDNDESLRGKTLLRLSLLPPEPFAFAEDTPFRLPQPVPLKKEPLFAELQRFLSDSNPYHIELALGAITNINPSGAELHIQPLLKHASRDVRISALHWYSRRSNNPEAIPTARELLFQKDVLPTDNYAVIGSLEIYCQSENETVAAEAARPLAEFILRYVDYPGNDMANLIGNAMGGLKAARFHEERKVIWALFRSQVKDWRRGVALRRLAEIEGKAQIGLLKESLADRDLRQFAAQGIAEVAQGSDNSQLVDVLLKALQEENREDVIRNLINALIAVEGEAVASRKGVFELLPPYDAMRIHWLTNKISPDVVARYLSKAEIIDLPTEELLQQLRVKWHEDHDALFIMVSLLGSSNRLFWFDRETSTVPPDYADIFQGLFNIGHGVFTVESFSQEFDEETEELEIQFIYDERVHTFRTLDSSWYDAEAVLLTLNEALSQSGKRERYILLHTGDQTCIVIFAPEDKFRSIAQQLCLPM